jgi:hypothetical protein
MIIGCGARIKKGVFGFYGGKGLIIRPSPVFQSRWKDRYYASNCPFLASFKEFTAVT